MASFLPSEDWKGNQHQQQSINQDNNEKNNLAGSTQLERVLADAGRDLANADLGSPMNELRDAGAGVLLPILGVLPNVIPHIAKSVPFADSISAFCLSVPFNMARASYGLLHHFNGSEDVETILDSRRRRSLITDTRLEAFLAEEVRRKCDQVSTADLDHQFLTEQDGSFTFKNIAIHSSDGTFLSANVMEPTMKKGDELPAVIFINSWTFTEHEYIIPASILARKGYVVLSYCTRGFGKSGGLVNVAGPLDQKDMGSVLDWLESNTQADMNNVGIAGISYGA